MSENENVNPEAAIPMDEQSVTAGEGAENTADSQDTTQNEVSETAISSETSGDNGDDAVSSFALEVQYNKESLTLNQKEAKDYAEQGMFYNNKIRPIYSKLDYLAAQKETTVEALVDGILADDEAQYRAELESKFGEDNAEVINDLMKVYRDRQKEKYDGILENRKKAEEQTATSEKQQLETRLATEFTELKAEFPDIADFASLPKEVKADAARGRDLLSSYLRYKHNEDKKIMAANKSAEEASKASTGSGASTEQTEDSNISALLNGIWK